MPRKRIEGFENIVRGQLRVDIAGGDAPGICIPSWDSDNEGNSSPAEFLEAPDPRAS